MKGLGLQILPALFTLRMLGSTPGRLQTSRCSHTNNLLVFACVQPVQKSAGVFLVLVRPDGQALCLLDPLQYAAHNGPSSRLTPLRKFLREAGQAGGKRHSVGNSADAVTAWSEQRQRERHFESHP